MATCCTTPPASRLLSARPPRAAASSGCRCSMTWGLIGGVIQTLYCGGASTLFSPVSFLQRPLRWLKPSARTGATISGGPNFAYDLCVEKTTPEQRAGLDLSCWRVAFNGAEPVRAETLDRFAEAFAPAGFRPEAFLPCYGLAEATLLVSAQSSGRPPVVLSADAEALGRGEVAEAVAGRPSTRLVSSGRAADGHVVAIVDPATGSPVPRGSRRRDLGLGPERRAGLLEPPRGEPGSHRRPPDRRGRPLIPPHRRPRLPARRRAVRHRPDQGPDHPPGEERLSAGRRVGGRMLPSGAPGRAEPPPSRSRPRARNGWRSSSRSSGGSRGVRPRRSSRRSAVRSPRRSTSRSIAIRLIRTTSLPRTSSGKVRRHACREAFLAGSLETVAEWTRPDTADAPGAQRHEPPAPAPCRASSGSSGSRRRDHGLAGREGRRAAGRAAR